MKNQIFASIFLFFAAALVYITFGAPELILAAPFMAGIISSVKLKEQRTELENELLGIINKAKEEKRDFSAEETTKRAELVNKITDLTSQIELRSREEEIESRVAGVMINRANEKQEDKEVRNYSFVRALAQVNKSGRLEGLEAEMDQEARKEFASSAITPEGILTVPSRVIMSNERRNAMREARAVMTATGQDGGSTFVQTDVIDFIGALYDKNVLTSMGSRMLTGLVGNIQMPKSGGSSAAWEDEVETNVDVTPVISPITASPKRLGGFGLVSKQLLHQAGNYQVEKLIQDDIISGINQALQVRGITELLATEGIGAVIGGANGAAPTAAHIIELEEKVATAKADVGSLAYLTNPKVRAKLKKTALDAGSGQFVWDLKSYNELMGYVAGITTSVPSNIAKNDGTDLSAIIFGNFSDLLICGWGGFDIVLNPYTNAKTNQLEIIINSYWDMIIRNAGSFAAMQDAKTAD